MSLCKCKLPPEFVCNRLCGDAEDYGQYDASAVYILVKCFRKEPKIDFSMIYIFYLLIKNLDQRNEIKSVNHKKENDKHCHNGLKNIIIIHHIISIRRVSLGHDASLLDS